MTTPSYLTFKNMNIDFLESIDVRKIAKIAEAICRYAASEMERQKWFNGYMFDDLQSLIDNIGKEQERWYYLNVLRKLEVYSKYQRMGTSQAEMYVNIINVLRYSYFCRNNRRPRVIPDIIEWIKFLSKSISVNCNIAPEQVVGVITEICIGGSV